MTKSRGRWLWGGGGGTVESGSRSEVEGALDLLDVEGAADVAAGVLHEEPVEALGREMRAGEGEKFRIGVNNDIHKNKIK